MTDDAIHIESVSKTYGRRIHAVREVAITVRRGEIFGLLGPNGAGKSTLVKILMTVVRPTHVRGHLLGAPIGYKPALSRVGYLPESHRFPRYLTGRQTLEFFGSLALVNRAARRRRADELLERVGMAQWGGVRVSRYSKGMMQRVGLAQALINDPDLVVLDEPTDGVDPMGRRHIRDVLLALRQAGKTIFINSHLLSELEMICDRVAILVSGKVARQGTIADLTRESQWYEIELATQDPPSLRPVLRALFSRMNFSMSEVQPSPPAVAPGDSSANPGNASPAPALDGSTFSNSASPMSNGGVGAVSAPRWPVDAGRLPDGTWIESCGPWIRLGAGDPLAVQPIVDALRSAGLVIARMTPVRLSLEDLFMRAVAGSPIQ